MDRIVSRGVHASSLMLFYNFQSSWQWRFITRGLLKSVTWTNQSLTSTLETKVIVKTTYVCGPLYSALIKPPLSNEAKKRKTTPTQEKDLEAIQRKKTIHREACEHRQIN